VGTTLIYGFIMSLIILKLVDLTIGLRVTVDEEREGLDLSQHGEAIE
jgi:Amt family ammonium transporter